MVARRYRGYYTVARRYEFYFRVAKQYFTNERSVSSSRRVMFFLLETLSTTTGATTTAYRKQIFCSGHAQKLNNCLQSAVVLKGQSHELRMRDFLPLGALTQ